MTKALFLADSLAMPRLVPGVTLDDQIWTSIVAKSLKHELDFFFYTVAGLHTGMVVENLPNILGGFRPDVMVMQIGIVDCAPKALRELERKIVMTLPRFLRERIHRFLSRHHARVTNARQLTYVTPGAFRSNLRRIRDHFSGARILVLPIGPPCRGYIQRSPRIAENIDNYNQILAEVFGQALLADLYAQCDAETLYLADHHHLSVTGHAHIAERITRAFRLLAEPR